ncbi:MAG: sugar kinase [Pelodictyon luteolum]|uniref:Sugar kinase n=1 Tax=Pelodictyon luteolum TaxID=1100 RepID=A0A165LAS2_PELLU|nr:ROK family protein [Pelodictyon luteolum]KZK73794.1 MAG: sugar kinase [Pelodictyon luteolum]
MSQWAIGIDLGGTAVKAAVVGRTAGIITETTVPTEALRGPNGVLDLVAATASDLYRSASVTLDPGEFRGIGLGAPGAVDRLRGTLSHPPNLPGWEVVELRRELQKRLNGGSGIDCEVFLDNDANAAAYGEAVYGAGRAFPDFLMVTLGTGVGGGIVLNHELYRGPNGTAGEVGFMIVDYNGSSLHAGIRGTLEGLIGKDRLVEMARRMIAEHHSPSSVGALCGNDWASLSPRHLEAAALEGDLAAQEVWTRVGSILGTGLASVTALMDIRKFVVGGGISAAGDLLLKPALAVLQQSTLPSMHDGLSVVRADLGNRAGMHGAAALCFSAE